MPEYRAPGVYVEETSFGTRTIEGITPDPGMRKGKHVDVRRYLDYLEVSLSQGIQWAVFEPNDEPLWPRCGKASGISCSTSGKKARHRGRNRNKPGTCAATAAP